MLGVSSNESRSAHGHVLLPGTSLTLPVKTLLHGDHFKGGWPGTAPGGQQTTTSGEEAEFGCWGVPNLSLSVPENRPALSTRRDLSAIGIELH